MMGWGRWVGGWGGISKWGRWKKERVRWWRIFCHFKVRQRVCDLSVAWKICFCPVYEGQLVVWINGEGKMNRRRFFFLSYLHSSRIPQGQGDQARQVCYPAASSSLVLWKKHGAERQGHWAASSYVPLTVCSETTPERKDMDGETNIGYNKEGCRTSDVRCE